MKLILPAKTIGAIKLQSTQTDEVTSSVIQHSTISIAAAVKLSSKEALSKIVREKLQRLIFLNLYTQRGDNNF